MFSEYIQAALKLAEYDTLEDGSYVATVEGLQGIIAIGDTIEECRKDLIEVIEGWIALRLRLGDSIPPIKGISINVSAEPVASV
ncbi:MAG: type II toxin-antitoxin system HicB family antitoxin [Methanothrix sp.]|jgi:predicted RNase H-like HicB family nuclease|nr:type II toxin-antitoxin system HicB family antitoxin [Methanothrix sp.]